MGTKSGIDGVLDVAVVSGGVGGGDNAASGLTGSAAPSSADYLGFSQGGLLVGVSSAAPLPVSDSTNYSSPDGRAVKVQSNAAILFSDDFGGATLDTTIRWDVIDGGLPANPTLHGKSLSQSAIGSGVTGMTDAVANSALTVTMGTTANAERWYLSQQAFAGAEDLLVLLSKSQAIAANSIWIGLVEVDPTTLIPLCNANSPSYTINSQAVPFYFTNAGGAEVGLQTVNTSYATAAVGDSSSTAAAGSTGTALAALTASSEFFVEFHAEDVIASNGAVDSVAAKNANPSRVSTQVPNDGKVYKLLMRFRNVGTPASSTSVTVQRVLLWNSQEMRVEVASGRGDQNPQKAVAINVANNPVLGTGGSVIGSVYLQPRTTSGAGNAKTITTGLTGVAQSSGHTIFGYDLLNVSTGVRYLQLYNSTSGTFGSQGTPLITVPIPAGAKAQLYGDMGMQSCATGVAWAITADGAGASQTGVSSGDVIGTVYTN
ncbi:MAG TPA: hypothetical protein VGH03_17810 [Caulobacteraceae bacterium]|jgi:hypothetical protein